MRKCSWKAKGALWISEINWPLKDTGNFSPCKGSVLVDEQIQANYLTRAYLMAIASGQIRTCYWHQLVAPGYGLVDNRGDEAIRRPSYHAFKALNSLYNEANILHFDNGNYAGIQGLYSIRARTLLAGKPTIVQAFWSNSGEHQIDFNEADRWLDQNGDTLVFENETNISISGSVLYALSQDSSAV